MVLITSLFFFLEYFLSKQDHNDDDDDHGDHGDHGDHDDHKLFFLPT